MDEIDIWRSASQLIKTFGADAAKHAELRAAQLEATGDLTGRDVMLRVAATARELQRMESTDKTRH